MAVLDTIRNVKGFKGRADKTGLSPSTEVETQLPTDTTPTAPVVPPVDTITEEPTVEPGGDYVTPEALVSTQLTSLLEGDSPYMKQAARQSEEMANRLGLLSSSMAVGAGQRAAIEAALPIAQQDAGTYAQFGLAEQKQVHDVSRLSMNIAADKDIQRMRDSNTVLLQQLSGKQAASLQAAHDEWDRGTRLQLSEIDNNLRTQLQDNQISQERYTTAMSSMNGIMQNTQTNINSILRDPDISMMDPGVVANMLNNVQAHATASMEFVGGVGQIPDYDLDVLLSTFENATQWGVDATPAQVYNVQEPEVAPIEVPVPVTPTTATPTTLETSPETSPVQPVRTGGATSSWGQYDIV